MKKEYPYPKVFAHRGASAYEPENTLRAFKKSAELGCDWLEFDVQLSFDNEVIVFHDHTLERLTNGWGNVADYSYEEIYNLNVGRSNNIVETKIPTLNATLELLRNKNMKANVELKPHIDAITDTVKATHSVVQEKWEDCDTPLLFSSFCWEALAVMRELDPNAHLAMLLRRWRPEWLEHAEKLNVTAIHLKDTVATKKHIKEIKKHGFYIGAYTVDSPNRAKELYQIGVDAIFSNCPDKILAVC